MCKQNMTSLSLLAGRTVDNALFEVAQESLPYLLLQQFIPECHFLNMDDEGLNRANKKQLNQAFIALSGNFF